MRRSINSAKNASNTAPKQTGGYTMTRRSVSTDENCVKSGKAVLSNDDANQLPTAGPVTARLKMLEKKCSQMLEMQTKLNILDKWIQQQFSIKLFPAPVVSMEKISEGDPEDSDNPFYAVYLLCQRVKFLEDKVKKLETRPFDDFPEPKPTSNYSSAHSFRNFKGSHSHHGKATSGSGTTKRPYGAASPTTPKKPKLIPRPVPVSSNYPFKPSVKILPKDPNASPIKKETSEQSSETSKTVSPTKQPPPPPPPQEEAENKTDIKIEQEIVESKNKETVKPDIDSNKVSVVVTDDKELNSEDMEIEDAVPDKVIEDQELQEEPNICSTQPATANNEAVSETSTNSCNLNMNSEISEDTQAQAQECSSAEMSTGIEKSSLISEIDDILAIQDSASTQLDDAMNFESGQEEMEEMEVEQKPSLPLDEEFTGDVSGSEASVSSLASSSSKPRQSTRRRQAIAVAVAGTSASASSSACTKPEEEKPVMYTARGRRHTVPRRYAEFTGHDNVVSILKSQQRAEKAAALTAAGSVSGSTKGGKRQSVTPTKLLDTPPKIKKMVKVPKTPSPKKGTDNEGEGESVQGKKKASSSAVSNDRPPCVDALVDRVMAREVDSDGMVVLSESYPNIYVNQQQLVTVIIRSNGKSTRLTRKMTTLVFEDCVLASASPFGTKYYKDRLPPEPLEAMVDFIAESGFEPHYSKKKIYMIVGQVCNEARAGRVSRKFMQPLEAQVGPAALVGSQPSSQEPSPSCSSPNNLELLE